MSDKLQFVVKQRQAVKHVGHQNDKLKACRTSRLTHCQSACIACPFLGSVVYFWLLQVHDFLSGECCPQLRPILALSIAYLLGSIPFGYLVVRAKEGGDIRQTGSGGTGATNVSRRAGKFAGVLTLLLDALKGSAAVLFAIWVLRPPAVDADSGAILQHSAAWWVAAAALAVMIGHIFPVWLKFRGGKGVATGVGVFLVLMPAVVGIAALIFLGIVLLTRFVSLGSMIAALSIPVLTLLKHKFISSHSDLAPTMTVAVVGALLIVFAHRENLGRLIHGQESKFR